METHFAKPLIKRTLHNLEQLKQVVFFLHTFSSERLGFYLPRSSKGICQCLHQICRGVCATFLFFLLFFCDGTKNKIRAGERTARQRATRDWKGRKTGSGKRPVSPHLQPEPRLKCSSQHRRPMTHIEADKAPARVSEPSAGERERKKMCKKEKTSELATTSVRKKKVSEQTLI